MYYFNDFNSPCKICLGAFLCNYDGLLTMLIPVRKSLVLLCVFYAISMQYVIPMVNNISVNASNALMQMEYTGSSGNNKKTMSNQQTNLQKI